MRELTAILGATAVLIVRLTLLVFHAIFSSIVQNALALAHGVAADMEHIQEGDD